MRAAADLVEAEVAETARMLTVEMGKPIGQSAAEVLKCAENRRFYADKAEGFAADEPLANPAAVSVSAAWARCEPLGVVLAAMPWNYSLRQVIRFAAPALMAGNTGLFQHASNEPQSALYLDTRFERAGSPARSFNTLLIGRNQLQPERVDVPDNRTVQVAHSEREVKNVNHVWSRVTGPDVWDSPPSTTRLWPVTQVD